MVRLGILGCADVAYKRFMPAAQRIEHLKIVAVAEERTPKKLDLFCAEFHIEGESSFERLILRDDIDAVYIPLPPALHHRWAKFALEHGKHVLVEKPSTTSYDLSNDLVETANTYHLALHENYMFCYHSQIRKIQGMLQEGLVGDIRLVNLNFGFPMRMQNDFRYQKALGGGALLDAGGYPIKLASILLGNTVKVDTAQLNSLDGFEVDMYGSASLSNDTGTVCQLGFGMDSAYRCSLEVWGSKGRLSTNRIFTAPDGYQPVVKIETPEGTKEIVLEADSHFQHSIEHFLLAIECENQRKAMYDEILLQAKLVEEVRNHSEK